MSECPPRRTATVLNRPDIVPFFQGLADDWSGWSGTREWWALEGEMGLDACHDGRGNVTLGVTLKRARTSYADATPGPRTG